MNQSSEFRKALVATVLLLSLTAFITATIFWPGIHLLPPQSRVIWTAPGLIIILVGAALYIYAIVKLVRTERQLNVTSNSIPLIPSPISADHKEANMETDFQTVQKIKASGKRRWDEVLTALVEQALKGGESNVELTIGVPEKSRVLGREVAVGGKLEIRSTSKENISEVKALAVRVEELSKMVKQLLEKEHVQPKREEHPKDEEEIVPLY